MQTVKQRTALVPPQNFPVNWEHPEDEQLFWGRSHAVEPYPLTPMSACILAEASTPNFNVAAEFYGSPARYQDRRINTYHYYATTFVTTVPEDLETMTHRSQVQVEAAMARLGDWWQQELLPEIAQHLAAWETFDLRGTALPDLLAHLDDTVARMRRIWRIELLLAFPHLLAPSLFADFYSELFPSAPALEPYRLLQGLDNKTVEGDRALQRLSRQALSIPAVAALLQEHDAAYVPPLLEEVAATSPEGYAFLMDLRAYLQAYGQRDYTQHELATPSWLEDPTPAIRHLQLYVTLPDRDAAADPAGLAAERKQCIVTARAALRGYPQPVRERFDFLLKAAQEANIIAEDHNFWIDGRSLYHVRRVLVEWGHRLAGAAVIGHTGDVFFLTLDELREIACSLAEGIPVADRRPVIAARQAEMAYFRTIDPPRMLGTPPVNAPPAGTPLVRALGRFGGVPVVQEDTPQIIRGHAGSSGVVRGPARVLATLADGGRLRPGEILVTGTTATEWTPLFGVAAAIVTDAGGVLSHCAVVAREYRLPAVVGTGVATARIQDGQMLEVDGTNGVVRLLTSVVKAP